MEQVRNEQTIYSAAVYCRLSKDDEQAGESVSMDGWTYRDWKIEWGIAFIQIILRVRVLGKIWLFLLDFREPHRGLEN